MQSRQTVKSVVRMSSYLFRFGKMILQYAPAERVDLAVEDVRPAGPRGRQVEAADAAE